MTNETKCRLMAKFFSFPYLDFTNLAGIYFNLLTAFPQRPIHVFSNTKSFKGRYIFWGQLFFFFFNNSDFPKFLLSQNGTSSLNLILEVTIWQLWLPRKLKVIVYLVRSLYSHLCKITVGPYFLFDICKLS